MKRQRSCSARVQVSYGAFAAGIPAKTDVLNLVKFGKFSHPSERPDAGESLKIVRLESCVAFGGWMRL